jgi:hypothetical protein
MVATLNPGGLLEMIVVVHHSPPHIVPDVFALSRSGTEYALPLRLEMYAAGELPPRHPVPACYIDHRDVVGPSGSFWTITGVMAYNYLFV